jgi:hypothetical protein
MNRMHKPDPKLGPDQQDKRSVIPIERGDVDQWLAGTVKEATELLRLAPADLFVGAPSTVPAQPPSKPKPPQRPEPPQQPGLW